jgi:DNA-binding winged helix-turn-helix (wHTH) protein
MACPDRRCQPGRLGYASDLRTRLGKRPKVQFVFGDHVLDPDRRELTRGAKAIAVGPQVFDLLLYLVQNRERVVSKDQLLDVVWGGRIVSESTLTSHINAARKAIGDSGREQHLIRTVARKGFRFVLTSGKYDRRMTSVLRKLNSPSLMKHLHMRWSFPTYLPSLSCRS